MMEAMDHRPAFQLLHGKTPAELFSDLPTPCYIIDEAGLQRNGEILSSVIKNTGCKILLAQKAFSNYDFYPLLSGYLSGTEASGLFEARLGAEKIATNLSFHIILNPTRADFLQNPGESASFLCWENERKHLILLTFFNVTLL